MKMRVDFIPPPPAQKTRVRVITANGQVMGLSLDEAQELRDKLGVAIQEAKRDQ